MVVRCQPRSARTGSSSRRLVMVRNERAVGPSVLPHQRTGSAWGLLQFRRGCRTVPSHRQTSRRSKAMMKRFDALVFLLIVALGVLAAAPDARAQDKPAEPPQMGGSPILPVLDEPFGGVIGRK